MNQEHDRKMRNGLLDTAAELEDAALAMAAENEHYLYGNCHVFALALHRVSGWPLGTAMDDDMQVGLCLTHAFAPVDGLIVDIKGARTFDEMLADFPHTEVDQASIDIIGLAKLGGSATPAALEEEVVQALPVAKAIFDIATRQLACAADKLPEKTDQPLVKRQAVDHGEVGDFSAGLTG